MLRFYSPSASRYFRNMVTRYLKKVVLSWWAKRHFIYPLPDNSASFEVWEGLYKLQMLNLKVLETPFMFREIFRKKPVKWVSLRFGGIYLVSWMFASGMQFNCIPLSTLVSGLFWKTSRMLEAPVNAPILKEFKRVSKHPCSWRKLFTLWLKRRSCPCLPCCTLMDSR